MQRHGLFGNELFLLGDHLILLGSGEYLFGNDLFLLGSVSKWYGSNRTNYVSAGNDKCTFWK